MEHPSNPVPSISPEVEDDLQEIEHMNEELTEENFTDVFQSMRRNDKAEFGGPEYVTGYIIRKLKNRFPELELEEDPFNEGRDGWINSISLGNLTIQSLRCLNLIMKWETYFQIYMPKTHPSIGARS